MKRIIRARMYRFDKLACSWVIFACGVILIAMFEGCTMVEHKDPLISTFVIHKHKASHLHYDFRLAIDGVLKSWAVPKGIPQKTSFKRLAIETDDHPLEYASFEGTIPEGSYGAGEVEIWDSGTFTNIKKGATGTLIPLEQCLKKGTLEINFQGKKIRGNYALVRIQTATTGTNNHWLLIKMRDR